MHRAAIHLDKKRRANVETCISLVVLCWNKCLFCPVFGDDGGGLLLLNHRRRYQFTYVKTIAAHAFACEMRMKIALQKEREWDKSRETGKKTAQRINFPRQMCATVSRWLCVCMAVTVALMSTLSIYLSAFPYMKTIILIIEQWLHVRSVLYTSICIWFADLGQSSFDCLFVTHAFAYCMTAVSAFNVSSPHLRQHSSASISHSFPAMTSAVEMEKENSQRRALVNQFIVAVARWAYWTGCAVKMIAN